MRNIIKVPVPDFFISDTSSLTSWNQYLGHQKRNLKTHILTFEQYELCCYCETKINLSTLNCHIEHLRPKNISAYEDLIFDYSNLAVSCEGNHFNEEEDASKNTCGHCKNGLYNDALFLNPVETSNLKQYFTYSSTTGKISATNYKKISADYTIELLNLNGKNSRLAEARLNAKNALLNVIALEKKDDEKKNKLHEILSLNNVEFISFLRYCFY